MTIDRLNDLTAGRTARRISEHPETAQPVRDVTNPRFDLPSLDVEPVIMDPTDPRAGLPHR